MHTDLKINTKILKEKQPDLKNIVLKPPIFICGSGRSGTKFLLNILGKHKNICSIEEESHLFVRHRVPNYFNYERFEKNNEFEKLALSMLSAMYYGVEIAEDMTRQEKFPKEVKELFQEISFLPEFKSVKSKFDIFDLCAKYLTLQENKKRWVEKTPGNIRNSRFILRLYPNAKFIEIYRDPRAVYLSWKYAKQLYFRRSNIFECLKVWRQFAGLGSELGETLKGQYYRLKYENLLNNPEGELKNICAYLNEEFDPGMLEIKVVNSFFEDIKNENGFSVIPLNRWKKGLSNNEKILIDLLTKKYRKDLNYPDSNAKLNIFNLIPFIIFAIKKCIDGKSQLKPYIRSRLRNFLHIFLI